MSECILETEWTSHILANFKGCSVTSDPRLWAFFGLYLEAVATIQSIINTHVNREQMSSYCLQKYL